MSTAPDGKEWEEHSLVRPDDSYVVRLTCPGPFQQKLVAGEVPWNSQWVSEFGVAWSCPMEEYEQRKAVSGTSASRIHIDLSYTPGHETVMTIHKAGIEDAKLLAIFAAQAERPGIRLSAGYEQLTIERERKDDGGRAALEKWKIGITSERWTREEAGRKEAEAAAMNLSVEEYEARKKAARAS